MDVQTLLFCLKFASPGHDDHQQRDQLPCDQWLVFLLRFVSLMISLLHLGDLNLVFRNLVCQNLDDRNPRVTNRHGKIHREKKLNLNGHLSVHLDGTNYYLQASLLLITLKVTAI
jgi:hypothetical protein